MREVALKMDDEEEEVVEEGREGGEGGGRRVAEHGVDVVHRCPGVDGGGGVGAGGVR